MTILVTGGCGFIGSNFIRMFMESYPDERVVNVDSLTYAASTFNLAEVRNDPRHILYRCNINNHVINDLISVYEPRAIIHFAAESHVDRSIKDSSPFLETNILGTVNLLEAVRKHNKRSDFRFIHVSTDEVYGSLEPDDPASTETSLYAPRSPYAASKAASDHMVNAYHVTHGIPTIITNCSNNYGPYQHPEKFLPVIITKALEDKPIPVYGTGNNIRDWLHVSDHCRALLLILEKGKIGEKYNIGGDMQMSNNYFATKVLQLMDKPQSLIEYVEDRKGHDFRYDIDSSKLRDELDWKPKVSLTNGLIETIEFYKNNTLYR